jgi:putative peptidoglycan lipid II flippase
MRDKMLAHVFGAGIDLDLYYAAFRVPDLVYTVVATMVSAVVLIPILSQKKSEHTRRAFIHSLFFIFGILLLLISGIIYALTPYIVNNFYGEIALRGYADNLIKMIHILLLQPVILGLSNIVASVMQYYKHYFIYALAPIMYNIGIILGIIFFIPVFGLSGLALGVVLGAFLHFLIQIPAFVRLGYMRGERTKYPIKDIILVITKALPRTIALSANQVTLFILVAFASKMYEGSISVFNLAFNLQAAPLTIIAGSYSTAVFPTLARLFAGKEMKAFSDALLSAMRHIIFWSLPMIVLIIVLRAQIVRVIFGSGNFDWTDTRLTAAALGIFIVSLTAQGVIMLFVRAYYATSQMLKPQFFTVIFAVMTIMFAELFMNIHATHEFTRISLEGFLRTTEAGSTDILMLPLAYSAAGIITAFLISWSFLREFKIRMTGVLTTIFQASVASIVMLVATYGTLQLFGGDYILNTKTLFGIFGQGAVAGMVGIFAHIFVLWYMGNTEVRIAWKTFHHKVWKTKKIMADQDIT